MPTVVRLPVAVWQSPRPEGWRSLDMHVTTPASAGTVRVSASNLAPHRAAVFLYLAEHDGHIGPVEHVRLTQEAGTDTLVWHFVATLELRDDH